MDKLVSLGEDGGVWNWQFIDGGSPLKRPPREERIPVHSFIISDMHFGSSACRARALHAALNTFWITDNLVINGDAFQDSNLRRVSDAQQKAIERIRKLRDIDTQLHDIWVLGNHDTHVFRIFSMFLGLTIHKEYEWECGGKRYLAIHGDQWDQFVSTRPGITQVIIWFHDLIQKLDPLNRHVTRLLFHAVGRWRREHERVAQGAAKYGKGKGVDYVICGHTHKAMRQQFDGIEYLNSGSWTQNPCSFITITEDGPRLNYVHLS